MANEQQITQEIQGTQWGITAKGRIMLALDRQAVREQEAAQQIKREMSLRAGPKAFSMWK